MDAIWLPVLWHEERLANAVSVMEQAHCFGALVEEEGRYAVVTLNAVNQAMSHGGRTLQDVKEREGVHVASAQDAALDQVDLVRPLHTGLEYERLLDRVQHTYTLVAHAYDIGLLITRHEGGRRVLSRSSTYYCSGGRQTHTFPRPDVVVNQECPKCRGNPRAGSDSGKPECRNPR